MKFDFPARLCKVFATSHMRFSIFTRASLAVLLAFSPVQLARARTSPDPGQVALAVARWLEQAHYSRKKLDDEMSAQ